MGTGAVFDTYMNVFFWEFPTEDMKMVFYRCDGGRNHFADHD